MLFGKNGEENGYVEVEGGFRFYYGNFCKEFS